MAHAVIGLKLDGFLQGGDRLVIISQPCLCHSVLHIGDWHLWLLFQDSLQQRDRFLVTRVFHIEHGIVQQIGNFDLSFGIDSNELFFIFFCTRRCTYVTERLQFFHLFGIWFGQGDQSLAGLLAKSSSCAAIVSATAFVCPARLRAAS